MAKNNDRPAPKIHELKPQPTIAKAVAAASQHVANVNAASKK
jgi:hypothetical protein